MGASEPGSGDVNLRWLAVMRHGQTFRPHLGDEQRLDDGEDLALSVAGFDEVTAVAERFAEDVLGPGKLAGSPDEVRVLTAPTVPARETAALLAQALRRRNDASGSPAETSDEAGQSQEPWRETARRLETSRTRLRAANEKGKTTSQSSAADTGGADPVPPTEDSSAEADLDPTATSGSPAVVRDTALAPSHPKGLSPLWKDRNEFWDAVDSTGGNAASKVVVVVGHDPQMSHLLHTVLGSPGRHRQARLVSLAHGEVAMVAVWGREARGATELVWSVSPGSPKDREALLGKVKSKMDTAKVFGSFLSALAVFAVTQLVEVKRRPDWFPYVAAAGVGLLAFSVVAFLVTMFLYDSLTMPTRFWSPDPPIEVKEPGRLAIYRWVGTGQRPRRPPSGAETVLFHGMLRVWGGVFVPAVLSAGIGLVLVAIALVQPSGWWTWSWFAASVIVGVVVVAILGVGARPQLGTSD